MMRRKYRTILHTLTAKFIQKLIYGHKSQRELHLHRIVKDINDLIWIISREKKGNIKRTFKWKNAKEIWILYLNLTCAHAVGGGGKNLRYVSFYSSNPRKKTETLIIHLFCSSKEPSKIVSQQKYYESLSLFDTNFSLVWLKVEAKMFVQHKNVFYHCMKYLVIKEKFIPQNMCFIWWRQKKFVVSAT